MRLVVFIAVVAAAVVAFWAFGSDRTDTLSLVILGGWLAVLVWGALAAGERIGPMVRDLGIWALIFLAVVTAYVFRYDAQDFASRLTAGLIPGSPVTAFDEEGRASVTLTRLPNGHFETDALVNGRPVRFLIDTGATGIALSYRTAQSIGLPVESLAFTGITRTANGVASVAPVRLDTIAVGGIRRDDLAASVSSPGALGVNLLGQSFLESLAGYERRADRLTLRD